MTSITNSNQINSGVVSPRVYQESKNLNTSIDSLKQPKKNSLDSYNDLSLSKKDLAETYVSIIRDQQEQASNTSVKQSALVVSNNQHQEKKDNHEDSIKVKPNFLSRIGSKIQNLFKKIKSLPKKLINKIKLLFSRKHKPSNTVDKLLKNNDTIQSPTQENHQTNGATEVVERESVKTDTNAVSSAVQENKPNQHKRTNPPATLPKPKLKTPNDPVKNTMNNIENR